MQKTIAFATLLVSCAGAFHAPPSSFIGNGLDAKVCFSIWTGEIENS
jgi:hypothetical protein